MWDEGGATSMLIIILDDKCLKEASEFNHDEV